MDVDLLCSGCSSPCIPLVCEGFLAALASNAAALEQLDISDFGLAPAHHLPGRSKRRHSLTRPFDIKDMADTPRQIYMAASKRDSAARE